MFIQKYLNDVYVDTDSFQMNTRCIWSNTFEIMIFNSSAQIQIDTEYIYLMRY